MTEEDRKKLRRVLLGLLAAGGAGSAAYGAYRLRGGGKEPVAPSGTGRALLSRIGRASPYFLASLPVAIAARRVGLPALRNAVHVSEKTYNSKFLNKSRLGKWLKKFTRSSLYGDEVAREARKNGIVHALDPDLASEANKFIQDAADGTGKFVDRTRAGRYLRKILKNDRLYNFFHDMILGGTDLHRRPVSDKAMRLHLFNPVTRDAAKASGGRHLGAVTNTFETLDDKRLQKKILEQAGLGDMMPKNIGRGVIHDAIMEAAKKNPEVISYIDRAQIPELELRKIIADYYTSHKIPGVRSYHDVILKDTGPTAGFIPDSKNGRIIGVPDDQFERYFAKDVGTPGFEKHLVDSIENLRNVQIKEKMRKGSVPRKGLSGVLQRIFERIDYEGRKVPNIDEYRVHVVNGRVIPFATSHKWDVRRYFSTFATNEKNRIHDRLQDAVDRMLKTDLGRKLDLKNNVFGMDVGIRADGSPVIFEFNPSQMAGANSGSGQLMFGPHRNAVTDAIKGRMPTAQRIQLGAAAGLGAGSMTLTRKGWKEMSKESMSRPPLEKRAFGGRTFARGIRRLVRGLGTAAAGTAQAGAGAAGLSVTAANRLRRGAQRYLSMLTGFRGLALDRELRRVASGVAAGTHTIGQLDAARRAARNEWLKVYLTRIGTVGGTGAGYMALDNEGYLE